MSTFRNQSEAPHLAKAEAGERLFWQAGLRKDSGRCVLKTAANAVASSPITPEYVPETAYAYKRGACLLALIKLFHPGKPERNRITPN